MFQQNATGPKKNDMKAYLVRFGINKGQAEELLGSIQELQGYNQVNWLEIERINRVIAGLRQEIEDITGEIKDNNVEIAAREDELGARQREIEKNWKEGCRMYGEGCNEFLDTWEWMQDFGARRRGGQ
jgi:predicted  nucleic acid-binding Zn-ribbon protein